jgi:hypothetical protein
MLIVQSDAQRQTVTEHGQMPPCPAPNVNYPHSIHDLIAEQVDLRLHVCPDLGRLDRRV